MRRITGATRVAGLIGGPHQVAHSLSPPLHNGAFAALDLDWVYVGFPVRDSVKEAIRGLAMAGVAGLNVTMPHKLAAAAALDRLAGSTAEIGAVNTVEVTDTGLVGWNTDGEGLLSFLRQEAGMEVRGASVLVLGAGGSARSVVASIAAARAGSVTLAARSRSRAQELAALCAGVAFRAETLGPAISEVVAASDLIVNATPVGQQGESALIDPGAIRPGSIVVDLVYHPRVTRLVEAAARRGARAYGGLGMLVHQAALAFEIWTGSPAPLPAMWAAVEAAAATKR
ncbi:MAG: shikimate dehydrogenase [Actinomycetota bacterium]